MQLSSRFPRRDQGGFAIGRVITKGLFFCKIPSQFIINGQLESRERIMTEKAKRNDPCPCGSGKKYKNCCIHQNRSARFRKIKAKVIQSGGEKQPVDLMGRAFADAFKAKEDGPPTPIKPPPTAEKKKKHPILRILKKPLD